MKFILFEKCKYFISICNILCVNITCSSLVIANFKKNCTNSCYILFKSSSGAKNEQWSRGITEQCCFLTHQKFSFREQYIMQYVRKMRFYTRLVITCTSARRSQARVQQDHHKWVNRTHELHTIFFDTVCVKYVSMI